MMNLWTLQPGFPLLTVTKNGPTISVSQKPFQPADLTAVLDENFDGNNFSTIVPPTTTAASKNKNYKPVRWIFPVQYMTDNTTSPETLWLQSVEGILN